jgi:hypothetical protein
MSASFFGLVPRIRRCSKRIPMHPLTRDLLLAAAKYMTAETDDAEAASSELDHIRLVWFRGGMPDSVRPRAENRLPIKRDHLLVALDWVQENAPPEIQAMAQKGTAYIELMEQEDLTQQEQLRGSSWGLLAQLVEIVNANDNFQFNKKEMAILDQAVKDLEFYRHKEREEREVLEAEDINLGAVLAEFRRHLPGMIIDGAAIRNTSMSVSRDVLPAYVPGSYAPTGLRHGRESMMATVEMLLMLSRAPRSAFDARPYLGTEANLRHAILQEFNTPGRNRIANPGAFRDVRLETSHNGPPSVYVWVADSDTRNGHSGDEWTNRVAYWVETQRDNLLPVGVDVVPAIVRDPNPGLIGRFATESYYAQVQSMIRAVFPEVLDVDLSVNPDNPTSIAVRVLEVRDGARTFPGWPTNRHYECMIVDWYNDTYPNIAPAVVTESEFSYVRRPTVSQAEFAAEEFEPDDWLRQPVTPCGVSASSWEPPLPESSLRPRTDSPQSIASCAARHRSTRGPLHPFAMDAYDMADKFKYEFESDIYTHNVYETTCHVSRDPDDIPDGLQENTWAAIIDAECDLVALVPDKVALVNPDRRLPEVLCELLNHIGWPNGKMVLTEPTPGCAICDPTHDEPDVDWCNVCCPGRVPDGYYEKEG